jgi:hypothetical protein
MTKTVWDEDEEKWRPLSCYQDTIFELQPHLVMVLQDELPRQKRLSFKHDDGSSWSHHQFVNAVADAYLALARTNIISFETFGKLVLENAVKRGRTWYPDLSCF